MLRRSKTKDPDKLAQIALKKAERAKLDALEHEIWEEREHKSEVSGTWLGNKINRCFFHHILPKNSCPVLKFNRNNIILLTKEEHDMVEKDQNKYDEINKRRDQLLLILLEGDNIIAPQSRWQTS